MGVIGAKDSLVSTGSAVACTSKWAADVDADMDAIVCSVSRGGTVRIDGNTDWKGSFEGNGHTPPVKAGQAFTFSGVIGGTPGSQLGLSGPVRVSEVEINWDQEGGKGITYKVSFEGNGQWTLSNSLNVALPVSFPDPPPSKGTKLHLATPAASPSFTEMYVRTMSLKMKASNSAYVDSSTAGNNQRVEGNFDFEANFTIYFDDPTVLPTPNTVKHARLYVDGTTYWDLKWLKFGGITGIDVDRKTGKPVAATLPAMGTGATNISSTPTGGWVKQPNGTAVWDGST